jgi:hypothetical protein
MALDLPPERDLTLIFERDDVHAAFAAFCGHPVAQVPMCPRCRTLRMPLALAVLEWLALVDQDRATRRAPDAELLRFVALNGYAAYRNCMGFPRCDDVESEFHRATNPQPGDLVLETSTIWRWADKDSPGAALGRLLRVTNEPIMSAEKLAEMHANGECWGDPKETIDDIPTERVFYVAPLDRSVPEYRWVNADFIRLHDRHPRLK